MVIPSAFVDRAEEVYMRLESDRDPLVPRVNRGVAFVCDSEAGNRQIMPPLNASGAETPKLRGPLRPLCRDAGGAAFSEQGIAAGRAEHRRQFPRA